MRGIVDRLSRLVVEEEAGGGGGAGGDGGAGAAAGVSMPPVGTAAVTVQAGEVSVQTPATVEVAAVDPLKLSAEQQATLRGQLAAANPNAIAELITGDTAAAMLASVEGARGAFQRVANQVQAGVAASLPAGGGTREVDRSVYESLSPEGKIQFAINHPQG